MYASSNLNAVWWLLKTFSLSSLMASFGPSPFKVGPSRKQSIHAGLTINSSWTRSNKVCCEIVVTRRHWNHFVGILKPHVGLDPDQFLRKWRNEILVSRTRFLSLKTNETTILANQPPFQSVFVSFFRFNFHLSHFPKTTFAFRFYSLD